MGMLHSGCSNLYFDPLQDNYLLWCPMDAITKTGCRDQIIIGDPGPDPRISCRGMNGQVHPSLDRHRLIIPNEGPFNGLSDAVDDIRFLAVERFDDNSEAAFRRDAGHAVQKLNQLRYRLTPGNC